MLLKVKSIWDLGFWRQKRIIHEDDYKKCITSDSLGNVYATGETNGYGFTRNLLYKGHREI